MERAGTGLSDVVKFSKEGDGDAIFRIPPGSEDFTAGDPSTPGFRKVVLCGTGNSANRDIRDQSDAVFLPTAIGLESRVSGIMQEIAKKIPLEEIGTALIHSGELWSFAPAPLLHAVLEPVMIERSVREFPRDELAAEPDTAHVLSWLLRKHFESHLHALSSQGL